MRLRRTKDLNMSIEIYLMNRYLIEKIFEKHDILLACCNTTRANLQALDILRGRFNEDSKQY